MNRQAGRQLAALRGDSPPAEGATRMAGGHAAVAAARRGWFVFPCRRDGDVDRDGNPAAKRPLARNWEQRASSDPEQVARCWPGRRFNIGIAAGPSSLVVVDLDPPDGIAELERLSLGRELPPTYAVTTPRGGAHLYFGAPAGREIRNSAGKIRSGIDIRAHGGYAIGAGSVVGGRAYTVADGREPAPLPGWLADLACPARAPEPWSGPAPATRSASRYGAGALRREVSRIEAAVRGGRNAQLNASGWSLYRLVADGLLEEEPVTAALRAAADRCGLVADDGAPAVERTVASARRAGLAAPHLRRPA